MKAIIIIICITCSILWSVVNLSYANEMKVNQVNCTAITGCNACISGRCSYWICGPKDKPVESVCASPSATHPEAVCTDGKWIKLELQSDCYTNTTTTTTTTPKTTTTSTTSTTTQTPNTTTTEPPKTTTQLTTKLTPTSYSSSTETPETDTDKHLNGWTITGIVLLSVLVVGIIVGVAYKKVAKLYRSRNPYRNF